MNESCEVAELVGTLSVVLVELQDVGGVELDVDKRLVEKSSCRTVDCNLVELEDKVLEWVE